MLPALILTLVLAPVAFSTLADQSLSEALLSTGLATFYFTAALTASIVTYRLFFHRLRSFPGPRMAAATKFWNMALCVEGRTPWAIAEEHRKHGDIVRIGPNELSVLNVSAIQPIFKLPKGPFYATSFTAKGQSLHSLRTIKEHTERRKYWDRAFGTKQISEYSNFVRESGEEWIDELKAFAKSGDAVNMTDWCTLLTFDVMNHLAFGESSGSIKSRKVSPHVHTIEHALHAATIVGEIPWIIPALLSLPLGREVYDFSMTTMLKRQKRGDISARRDAFHYLAGEDQEGPSPLDMWELDGDIRLLIITGTDTVASTTNFIIFHLAQNPSWMKQLQVEVEAFRNRTLENSDLVNLKVLNAIIHETQRLNTVVPSKTQRATHHDPRNFSPEPLSWRPERWIAPAKEEAMNPKAFLPFSTGTFNCAGRVLAQFEMRAFVTMFALNFDVKLAPGFDVGKFERFVLDRFTVQMGPMEVIISNRA